MSKWKQTEDKWKQLGDTMSRFQKSGTCCVCGEAIHEIAYSCFKNGERIYWHPGCLPMDVIADALLEIRDMTEISYL